MEQRWRKLDDVIIKNYQAVSNRNGDQIPEYIKLLERHIQREFPTAHLEPSVSLENAVWASDFIINVRLTFDDASLMRQLETEPESVLMKIWRILLEQGIQAEMNLRLVMVNVLPPIKRKIAISDGNHYLAEKANLLEHFSRYEPDRLPQLAVWVKMWAEACDISAPFDKFLTPYALTIMIINYLQSCSPPVLPFFRWNQKTKKTFSSAYFRGGFQMKNTMSMAQLFHGFLEYLLIFPKKTHIFQILSEKQFTKAEKLAVSGSMTRWNTPIAIEDPLDVTENLGPSTTHQAQMGKHFWNIVRHTKEEILNTQSEKPREIFEQWCLGAIMARAAKPKFNWYQHREMKRRERLEWEHRFGNPVAESKNASTSGQTGTSYSSAVLEENSTSDESEKYSVRDDKLNKECLPGPSQNNVSLEEAISAFNLKSPNEWREMDKQICDFIRTVTPSKSTYDISINFFYAMQTRLMRSMPEATLQLHGSIVNGFYSRDRNLYICFQHAGENEPDGVDFVEVLQSLTKILYEWNLDTLKPETRSIVSYSNPTGKRIYISYYSTMRVYLSKLLAKYCEWDSRVTPLGIFIKNWAKGLNQQQAFKKTMHDSIWLIMMVHYLQNCDIPVLPRIQEDFVTAAPQPELIIERGTAFNVYFHKEKCWSKNTQSVAELFYGFLDYFSNFDYKNMVIQIRSKLPVHKLERNAIQMALYIEDPFKPEMNMTLLQDSNEVDHIFRYIQYSRDTVMTAGPINGCNILSSCRMNYIPEEILHCTACGQAGLCKKECSKNAEGSKQHVEDRIRFAVPLRPMDLKQLDKRNITKPLPDDDTIMKTFEESLTKQLQKK